MTVKEALKFIERYEEKRIHGEEDFFMFCEALEFLIYKTSNTKYMMRLGGEYYERRRFDLALKYYEMAFELGDPYAAECLGYIYYYGRTGEKNYEKAFKCFSVGMKKGDIESTYKIADMYKNGYFVSRDYEKYKEIIEDLYKKLFYMDYVPYNAPDVYTRLARIRVEEGKTEEATELYLNAKRVMVNRIISNNFFGNLNVMKWIVEALYRLIEFDENDFDLYDLYHYLKTPVSVTVWHNKKPHSLNSEIEDGEIAVCFDGKWFRTIDDFFARANIDGRLLINLYFELETEKNG